MRFALVTVALAAASASAFNLVARQNIPSCAGTCIASADLGGCSDTDDACLCKNSAFVSSTYACIEKTCTGSDLQAAITAAQSLCAAVGVTLSNVPTGSATTAAATGASSSATGSSPATVTTATTPASSHSASASAAASTAGSSTSSSAPAASSSKSAGSIVGVNAFAGMAAFGLAALAL